MPAPACEVGRMGGREQRGIDVEQCTVIPEKVPLELSRGKDRSLVDLLGKIVDDCARWLDELIVVDNANPSKRISVDFFVLGRMLF
jgi:hypothetical protein